MDEKELLQLSIGHYKRAEHIFHYFENLPPPELKDIFFFPKIRVSLLFAQVLEIVRV